MKEFNERKELIELMTEEQNFLIDIIKEIKPKKLLEVGVYRGGTSKLILDNINAAESQLYSIDLCSDEHIGDICLKENYENWKLFTGSYSYKEMDKIGKGVDCVFIDTDHVLPGELLDFLMIYPFLNESCTIFIHDIYLPFIRTETEDLSISPRMLFSVISGQKKEKGNLGAIFTHKENINPFDLLSLLVVPWNNLDIIGQKDLLGFFINHYGSEFTDQYKKIINLQLKRQLNKCKLIGQ